MHNDSFRAEAIGESRQAECSFCVWADEQMPSLDIGALTVVRFFCGTFSHTLCYSHWRMMTDSDLIAEVGKLALAQTGR